MIFRVPTVWHSPFTRTNSNLILPFFTVCHQHKQTNRVKQTIHFSLLSLDLNPVLFSNQPLSFSPQAPRFLTYKQWQVAGAEGSVTVQRMASTLLKVLLLVMVATCALTLLLLVPTSEAAGGGSSSFSSSNAGGGGGGLLRSKPRRRMFEANNIVPCDLQSYSYTAVNHDRATGTKCWDRVQLKSCYGHCHTAEVCSSSNRPGGSQVICQPQ